MPHSKKLLFGHCHLNLNYVNFLVQGTKSTLQVYTWDIGFTSSKWWEKLFKIPPAHQKCAAYHLEENKFLCRWLRRPISLPWLWRKSRGVPVTSWVSELHHMDRLPTNLLQEPLLHGREEISCHTDTPVLFRAADRQPTAKGPAATATGIAHPLFPGQGTQDQGSSFLCKGVLPSCDAEEWGLDLRHFSIEWKKKRKPICNWEAILKLVQITVWWIEWKGFFL